VAVSHHDATPLTSGKLVHHLRGRNPEGIHRTRHRHLNPSTAAREPYPPRKNATVPPVSPRGNGHARGTNQDYRAHELCRLPQDLGVFSALTSIVG
jgi:hypothetical protein